MTTKSTAHRRSDARMGDALRLKPGRNRGSGLTIPTARSTIEGIDVSHHQGTIDWAAVKAAGKRFAFIRVSDGTGTLDAQFENNWQGAKSNRIRRGAYQYFRPSQDAEDQAALMVQKLKAVGYKRGDMPPVIDVETTSKLSADVVLNQINLWLNYVVRALGRLPVLYTYPSFWSSLGNPTPDPLPRLWIAHWGAKSPTIPAPWTEFWWWQYSSTGAVTGIEGDVDLDIFNGNTTALKET